jgi:V8-like Glu-specific endopeptidase
MRTRSGAFRWRLGAALCLAAGCGAGVDDADDESTLDTLAGEEEAAPAGPPEFVEKLINGEFTDIRPEVGYMVINGGMCTATLIRRNVAITAAHCVEYRSADSPGRRLGVLTLEPAGGAPVEFAIDGYKAYSGSNDPGVRDVALLRLAGPVPAAVARPARLADRAPQPGEQILWMGYGCGRRGFHDEHSGRKQKLVFAFGGTDNSCPGDSGGPSFLGPDGPVFRVTSGYYTNGGGDIFGDAVVIRDRLNTQADAWSAAYPDEDPNPDPGPGPNDEGDDVAPAPPPPVEPDGPSVEYPDIAQTYLRGQWVALEWAPVSDAQRYAVLLMGRAADGQWAYTARFEAGKDTGRDTKYTWLSTRELCARMPAATRGQALYLSAEVRPGDEKSRARRAPVPQPLTCAP